MQSNKNKRGDCCAAINCSNSRAKNHGLSFYRFPKDPERCRKWVLNVRRSDLMKRDVHSLYNSFSLCANHFDDRQFMNRQQTPHLVHDAVPTLFTFYRPSDKVPSRRKPMVSITSASYREEYARLFGTLVKTSERTPTNPNTRLANNSVTKGKWCSVKGCPNHFALASCRSAALKSQQETLLLYAFPSSPEIRAKWLAFCQIPDGSDAKYVCCVHFVGSDFIPKSSVGLDGKKNPDLKSGAVPSRRLALQVVQEEQGNYGTRWAVPAVEYRETFSSDLENNSPNFSTDRNGSEHSDVNLSLENDSLRSQLARAESLLAQYMAKCQQQGKALKRLQKERARWKQSNKDAGDEVEKDVETTSTYIADTSEGTDKFLVTDVYTIEEVL